MADTELSAKKNGAAVETESNGTITFANEVIATIAGLAAADIPGVASMSGGFVDGMAEMIGRKNISKGIKVEVGQEEVAVDIAIIAEYGRPICQVAEQIQSSVKKAIETMTGLKVVEVNVAVEGIKFKDPDTKASEAPAESDTSADQAPRVK